MILSNGFSDLSTEEMMWVDGGISTADVAAFCVTAAGFTVGAVAGYLAGGPIGAAIGGEKGAKIGVVLGTALVSSLATKLTTTVINAMSEN